jgi:hypothetical protein
MPKPSPFKWFKTRPENTRLAVMMCVRFPLSLRNVENLLHERGIDICHETVRYWWHRFGPMFASEIKKSRIEGMKSSHWNWHLDEVFVKTNGARHYLWTRHPCRRCRQLRPSRDKSTYRLETSWAMIGRPIMAHRALRPSQG